MASTLLHSLQMGKTPGRPLIRNSDHILKVALDFIDRVIPDAPHRELPEPVVLHRDEPLLADLESTADGTQ